MHLDRFSSIAQSDDEFMATKIKTARKTSKKKAGGRAKKIALFNHKGGVSKTTTTFNLGWMLAEKGHKTILVDADPQCNLTGMLLGYMGPSELETFYKKHPERNIKAALAPAFESRPKMLSAVEC